MNSTLSDFFFKQSELTPNNIAITDKHLQLTYKQTAQQVKFLSRYLLENGYNSDSIISIYSSKRYEIIVAFLAVSSIGGSCVQLDKSFPIPLLENIITDTESDLILCDEIPGIDTINCLDYIDIISQYNIDENIDLEQPTVDPEKSFWLVYSSGTTGKNKGISISHRAILSSYKIRETIKPYNENSSIGCNIYYLWEAFRPLLNGGTTNIIPDDILYDFDALSQYIVDKNINEMLFTPSYLETLLSTAHQTAIKIFSNIKTCWLNGEVVSSWLQHNLEQFMLKTDIYNLYSISECHDVAVYKLHRNDKILEQEGVVPVGHVLPMVDAIVLDDNKLPVAHGEKGELYIHSIGLANEYINRPDLNAERFIDAKDSPIGKRLYRTGDYSKLSLDGKLISIYGRCDYIIKLRGYTLSLPFIEAVIKDKLDVMHCVVDKIGETRMSESLVAYLEVPKEKQQEFYRNWDLNDDNKPSKTLLDKISPHLAHYMIPSHIVIVDEIPLNKYSNKLERKLLNLEQVIHQNITIDNIKTINDYKNLWSNTLSIKPEDIDNDNCFFRLGGTSLQAMLLINHLKGFGFDKLKISDFVKNSTLSGSYSFLTNSTSNHNNDINKEILEDINTLFKNLTFPKTKYINTTSKNILITGATGFLGTHILKSLISNTHIKNIYCVVRAKDNHSAKQRIEDTLNKLDHSLSDKIIYLSGDISLKHFGWDSDTWNKYSNSADTVIHAAASVNLLLPYGALKSSNLHGTANILDFCLNKKQKHLAYISTNGIYPLHTNMTFDESKNIDWLDSLDSGYSQTKWASEKLVHMATKNGLKSTILRLGNISPEYNSYINESDTNWLLLQEIFRQKKIPNTINLEMTPIAHICHILEHILQEEQLDKDVYNIINKNLLNDNTLSKVLDYEIIDTKIWLNSVTDESIKYLVGDENNINASTDKYDRTNYEKLMKDINICYSGLTHDYINKVFIRK